MVALGQAGRSETQSSLFRERGGASILVAAGWGNFARHAPTGFRPLDSQELKDCGHFAKPLLWASLERFCLESATFQIAED
jgi:hypothetical protein